MPFRTGYCYLVAACPSGRSSVGSELGLWPAVESLLETSSENWLPTADLQRIRVEVVGDKLHCFYSSTWVVDALMMKPNFASIMACAAASVARERGSLAERLYREHVSIQLPEVFVESALKAKIGGDTRDANSAYWNAVGVYLSVLPTLVEMHERSTDKVTTTSFIRQMLGLGNSASFPGSEQNEDVAVDSSEEISDKTRLNRKKRQCAKDRKKRKQAAQCESSNFDGISTGFRWQRAKKPAQLVAGIVTAEDVSGELKDSVKRKWIAKNELQALEAERRVAVLKANSVEDEAKRHRTAVTAAIERNMVKIEEVHGKLRATGNVSGEYAASDAAKRDVFHGSAETVLTPDLTNGSISPDSSASQAEFRAAQKKILDLEAKQKEQEAYMKRCKDALAKVGLRVESVEAFDKQTFTDDTAGNDLIDDLYGDTGVCIHRVKRDGKMKIKLGAGEEFDQY